MARLTLLSPAPAGPPPGRRARGARAFLALALLSQLPNAAPASAQSREAQFGVRALVLADCTVNVQDLVFGVYNPESNQLGNTVINVRCTPGSAAAVSLSAGVSGNPRDRHMSGPGFLNYQLYRDIARQDPIDTTGVEFLIAGLANFGQPFLFPVYGEIPSGQSVPAGNYADVIRVTVQF